MLNTLLNRNQRFFLKAVLSSLFRRRSRIAVALLGIAVGATVLLGMVTLCYDIPRQMGQEFRSYGANLIFTPGNNQVTMSEESIQQAVALLPAPQRLGVTPFRYHSIKSNQQPYTLVGTDFIQLQKTSPYWQLVGRWPSQSNEIVIGADVANFTHLTVGRTIPITGKSKQETVFEQEMQITGIIKTGRSEDGFIFMSFTALETLLQESPQAEVVEISLTATASELDTYIAQIQSQLSNIEPHSVKWVTQSETAVLGKLTSLLYLVTSVVLVLTMICVATTMMTVILERSKEIGLKKALGAENQAIAYEFLLEGLILGGVGGLIGACCGVLFAELISREVFGRTLAIELYFIPITVLVSVIVTIIACLIPVKRAVAIEPALVLRGE